MRAFILCALVAVTMAVLLPTSDAAQERAHPATSQEKREWPELSGRAADHAREEIQKQFPHYDVKIVKRGSMVTRDVRPDRVRIFIDPETGLVVGAPKVG